MSDILDELKEALTWDFGPGPDIQEVVRGAIAEITKLRADISDMHRVVQAAMEAPLSLAQSSPSFADIKKEIKNV